MKKIIAIFLLIYMHASMADIYKFRVTPTSKLSANLALKNWKFRSVEDEMMIENLTNHPIEIMFYLNGKVIDDNGIMHLTDKVTASCNGKRWGYRGETTIFCDIEPGLSFRAWIEWQDFKNGAEGLFEINL